MLILRDGQERCTNLRQGRFLAGLANNKSIAVLHILHVLDCHFFLNCMFQYAVVWYSDDGGKTYSTAQNVLLGMDESALVELSDGSLMANMRNNHHNSCDCRAVSVSKDGGKTFQNITYDEALISPVSCLVLCLLVEFTCNFEYYYWEIMGKILVSKQCFFVG